MLVNQTMTQNFNAVSAVNVTSDKGDAVAFLNGNITQDGKVYINCQIDNWDLYNTHKKEVDADKKAFEDEVYSYVNKDEENE